MRTTWRRLTPSRPCIRQPGPENWLPSPPYLLISNSFESKSAAVIPLASRSTEEPPDDWDEEEDGVWDVITPPSVAEIRNSVSRHLQTVSAVKVLDLESVRLAVVVQWTSR